MFTRAIFCIFVTQKYEKTRTMNCAWHNARSPTRRGKKVLKSTKNYLVKVCGFCAGFLDFFVL